MQMKKVRMKKDLTQGSVTGNMLLFAAPTGPVHESVGFIPFIPFRFVVPL